MCQKTISVFLMLLFILFCSSCNEEGKEVPRYTIAELYDNSPLSHYEQTIYESDCRIIKEVCGDSLAEEISRMVINLYRVGAVSSMCIIASQFEREAPPNLENEYYISATMDNGDKLYFFISFNRIYSIEKDQIGGELVYGIVE